MGTRGCIARISEDEGFEGVYHHWDSYPTSLGKTLYDLYHNHFNKDLEAMLKVLIDEHPAGWSTINGKDFNLKAGWSEPTMEQVTGENQPPICYCHGGRSEEAWIVTQENASGSGCEWCYVFDKEDNTMRVLSSYTSGGVKMIGAFGYGDPEGDWRPVMEIKLNEPEPNWEKIEERGNL